MKNFTMKFQQFSPSLCIMTLHGDVCLTLLDLSRVPHLNITLSFQLLLIFTLFPKVLFFPAPHFLATPWRKFALQILLHECDKSSSILSFLWISHNIMLKYRYKLNSVKCSFLQRKKSCFLSKYKQKNEALRNMEKISNILV